MNTKKIQSDLKLKKFLKKSKNKFSKSLMTMSVKQVGESSDSIDTLIWQQRKKSMHLGKKVQKVQLKKSVKMLWARPKLI